MSVVNVMTLYLLVLSSAWTAIIFVIKVCSVTAIIFVTKASSVTAITRIPSSNNALHQIINLIMMVCRVKTNI